MFARVKKSGKYQYLQIVENRKEAGKVKQRVLATIGRMDQLQEKGRVETLIRSLSRFSEKALLILSGQSDVAAKARTIGPVMIFRASLEADRYRFGDQETFGRTQFCLRCRALDLSHCTASLDGLRLGSLLRPLASGLPDRWLWPAEFTSPLRAMAFLGEELCEQSGALMASRRRNKDLIEEQLFYDNRDLFTRLDLVFFDTTSIYFEGAGGNMGQGGSQRPPPGLKTDGGRRCH